jgi:hypothetical protein
MLAATTALAVLLSAAPAAPRAEGRIDSDQGRLELLGEPVRVGETIELPEGYIRVEEQGTEDRNVGSFSVVPARSMTPTASALAAQPAGSRGALAGSPGAPSPSPEDAASARFVRVRGDGPCRAERSAYLKDLWKMSGIEVSDPDALLLGLEGEQGAAAGFYWFALATDPFRPLAWSSDLRARAEALARCVRDAR